MKVTAGELLLNRFGQGLAFVTQGFTGFGTDLKRGGDGVAGGEGVVDHRIKIDKPALEQRLCHRLQRGVHLTVEFDFVVESLNEGDYAALTRFGWERQKWSENVSRDRLGLEVPSFR